MRELEYPLVKEDYKDWIHWNVEKNYSEKKRRKTLLIYAVIIVAFVAMSIVAGKGLNGVIPTLLLGVVMGWYLMRTTSFQSQEKMIWKRSGLEKLDKTGNYPTVHLALKDRGLVMSVAQQGVTKVYGYNDLVSVVEIERLFLLETADKTWQFVAKSAFESREEMDQFLAFINEKIAAAKEDPESYSQEAVQRQENEEENTDGESEAGEGVDSAVSTADTAAESEEEDAVVIEHVDTSNMGKIGKMAHIMAAMAAESEKESEAEENSAEEASAEESSAEESSVKESGTEGNSAEEASEEESAAEEQE